MSVRPLAIITTRLPPATCGIGAYSALLREHWPNDTRPVEYLVVDDSAGTAEDCDRVTTFNGNANQLVQALNQHAGSDVLLHYAGRAFHRFGAPFWLPSALAKWRKRSAGGRLMAFFHEVPGELSPTSRHYWLEKLNAHVIRRLAGLADVVVTNTETHRTALRRISGRDDVHVVPVSSNIAASDAGPTVRARTESMVFGLPFGRLQTLQWFDADIRRWIEDKRLTKLHLVGPAADRFPAEADELISTWPNAAVVVRHGRLPSPEVSRLLQQVGFLLTNVTEDTWSKSGAFMAAAANRCPIVVRDARSGTPPFSHAIAVAEVETIATEEADRRAEALAAWYRENADWAVVAQRIGALWPAIPLQT